MEFEALMASWMGGGTFL